MAQNLRSKLQPTDSLCLFDANPHVMKKLETDMSAAATGKGPRTELADSASAAAQDAVRSIQRTQAIGFFFHKTPFASCI